MAVALNRFELSEVEFVAWPEVGEPTGDGHLLLSKGLRYVLPWRAGGVVSVEAAAAAATLSK